MKTKILVLAVLLFGGLLFTSCQKDDALSEDMATEQLNAKDNFVDDHLSQWAFMIENYPDPFYNFTTIEYHLPMSGPVSLVVYKSDTRLKILFLEENQRRGIHIVRFNATGLPAGEYIAELKAGGKVLLETMTKLNCDNIDFIRPDEN